MRVGAREHRSRTEGQPQGKLHPSHRECVSIDSGVLLETLFVQYLFGLPCMPPHLCSPSLSLQDAQAGSAVQLRSILFTLDLLVEAAVLRDAETS